MLYIAISRRYSYLPWVVSPTYFIVSVQNAILISYYSKTHQIKSIKVIILCYASMIEFKNWPLQATKCQRNLLPCCVSCCKVRGAFVSHSYWTMEHTSNRHKEKKGINRYLWLLTFSFQYHPPLLYRHLISTPYFTGRGEELSVVSHSFSSLLCQKCRVWSQPDSSGLFRYSICIRE